MELDFNLEDVMEQEQVKEKEAKSRTTKAKKKKAVAKFEPSWEQVWNGYDKEDSKGNMTHKKGIWELKNADSDIVWLREVKVAVESGELGLTDPLTREPIPMSKFSKSKAKELFAVLEVMKREQRMEQIVAECPKNYYCITTTSQMEKLVKYLEDEMETGLDSETTGLDVYLDTMVGLSITLPKKDIHVYVPFGHTTGEIQLPKQYVLNKLKPYLYGDSKKYLHNAKFDRHMFIREGSDIKGFLFDSQIAMQVLNENEPSKRLKDLLTKYKHELGFKEDSWTFEQLFGKNAEFAKVPLDVATAYACKDTHGCYLLGKWQEKFLNQKEGLKNIFYNIEAPLLPIVVDMERAGLLVDLEFGKQYGKELENHLGGLMGQIKEELGDININSPAQLSKVLYDDLELEDISGKRGTGKDILKQLADEAPILNTLLEYRDLHKLHSTYISALPEKIKSDGRLHGQFIQDRTATGRFASKEPNLQNLPPRARHMFVAPENHVMVSIDLSQIEPRVFSHITGDEDLRKPYLEGFDLYSTLASKTFRIPIEQCGDGSKYRKMMKVGLLAVLYGTSMFTLAKQIGITVQEAEQFIEDFYKAYPKVEQWIENTWEFVKKNEYVETLYGRKRRFPKHRQQAEQYDKLKAQILKLIDSNKVPQDFWNKKKYPQLPYNLKKQFQAVKGNVERVRRQAVNAIIQGSSADIIKIAMLKMDAVLKKYGWKMIGSVHDELLMEVPISITHEQLIELESCMSKSVQLEIPIKSDVELQETWGMGFKFDIKSRTFFSMNEKTGELIFEVDDLETALKLNKEVG